MNLRHLFLILLVLLFVFQKSACASPTEEADKRLKTAVAEVISITGHAPDRKVLQEEVKPILDENISFEAMTRRAVGPGWRQFTPAQQKEAAQLFTILIIRTYTAKFTPGEFPVVTFKTPVTPAPGRVEIPTTSSYKGSQYDVVYRMEEADSWRITDVVTEGVSMIANYRTQFDSEFKQGGAPAVINALKRTLASHS